MGEYGMNGYVWVIKHLMEDWWFYHQLGTWLREDGQVISEIGIKECHHPGWGWVDVVKEFGWVDSDDYEVEADFGGTTYRVCVTCVGEKWYTVCDYTQCGVHYSY